MMRWLASIVFVMATLPAWAETIVLGLSHEEVSITTTFDGSNLLIFGAVRRDGPIPEGSDLDVIITVTGPPLPVEIRRKSRVAGVWMNTDAIDMAGAPSFYAVASTGPLAEILSEEDDLRRRVTIARAVTAGSSDAPAPFVDALIRIREGRGLYRQHPGDVALDEQTLFRTSIALPANIVEGDYVTRILLLRDGRVIDASDTRLAVSKVGLERFLYTLAHDNPPIYGVMALVIAVVSGWGGSALFRAFGR